MECLICLDEIEENDSRGKAWLSCECNQEYHATCLNTWLYTVEKIGLRNIVKSCPVCKGKSLYIVDFIPPHSPKTYSPPPSPPRITLLPTPTPPRQSKFRKFLNRIKTAIF